MTTLREAAQQALEALEGWDNYGEWVWPESALEQAKRNTTDALTTLRAALAEPVQEPVAWYDPKVMNEDRGISWTPGQFHTEPLYTSPPQRLPLTDEEIKELTGNAGTLMQEYAIKVARAIEAAHGIKGEA